jgi:hypothetical protein
MTSLRYPHEIIECLTSDTPTLQSLELGSFKIPLQPDPLPSAIPWAQLEFFDTNRLDPGTRQWAENESNVSECRSCGTHLATTLLLSTDGLDTLVLDSLRKASFGVPPTLTLPALSVVELYFEFTPYHHREDSVYSDSPEGRLPI